MQEMNSPSDIAQNMPNASMMYQTYTPTFGNLNFQIMPSQTGEVSNTFGTVPYMSLEGLVYLQQVQAQTNQANTTGKAVTGQNNVQGSITASDSVGNVRVAISGGSTSSNTGTF